MSDSDTVCVRRRVREVAVPSKFAGLGVKAVAILLKHASFDNVEGVAAMRRPLEALADKLGQLKPLDLYSEWSPPRDPALVGVALLVPASSQQKSTEFGASKALQADSQSYWSSGSTKSAWWSVPLEIAGTLVASVRLTFKTSLMPDSVVLEISTKSGSSPAWTPVASVSGKAIHELTVLDLPEITSVAQVREFNLNAHIRFAANGLLH